MSVTERLSLFIEIITIGVELEYLAQRGVVPAEIAELRQRLHATRVLVFEQLNMLLDTGTPGTVH
jgi:hypothetical protein